MKNEIAHGAPLEPVNQPIEAAHIMNDAVRRLEQECLTYPQIQIGLSHHLSGGMYARTGIIKAGCLLIGAEHKTDHINIMYGDITVTTDDGVQRLTGYHVLPTKAGKKRAGVAHADTVWTTICKTNETELSKIEDELVVESDKLQSRNQELANEQENAPCLEYPQQQQQQ